MIKRKNLTKEHFDILLRWLDPHLETAGQKFEKIRARLIEVFLMRGCRDAEELADETIDRVALKSSRLIDNYEGQPVLYFYGVAHRVHLEWLRTEKKKKERLQSDPDQFKANGNEEDDSAEVASTCLDKCLGSMSADKRSVVLEYYREERSNKIECRKDLSVKLGITVNALHIKIYRIRAFLEKCVKKCVLESSN